MFEIPRRGPHPACSAGSQFHSSLQNRIELMRGHIGVAVGDHEGDESREIADAVALQGRLGLGSRAAGNGQPSVSAWAEGRGRARSFA